MNVIVTGASSGIGYELVKRLVLDSTVKRVLAIARREEKLGQLSKECNSEKLTVQTFDLQYGDYEQLVSNVFFQNSEAVDVL
ncbi:MAG: NADP-dependent 3-hydroxy acid dehydrogenase YdfG, partial [Bacteroidia bacterium]